MVTSQQIQNWLQEKLLKANIQVNGDGHHFEAVIIDSAFAGKNRVERHRIVYGILGERMNQQIHALSLKLYTPEEHNRGGL